MKAGIVVPSRTPVLLTMHLLSHGLYTPPDEAVLFLVLNGPDADLMAEEALGMYPQEEIEEGGLDVRIVPCPPEPWFYGNLCNAGASAALEAGCTHLVFLNDDTVVRPSWLEVFEEDFDLIEKSGVKPGLVGARSEFSSGPQSIHDVTEVSLRMQEYARNQKLVAQGSVPPDKAMDPNMPLVFRFPRIVTFAAACTRAAWEASGGFDEKLPSHNWSDDILSCRMFQAGFPNFVGRCFIAHMGSQTLLDDEDDDAQEKYAKDMLAGLEYAKALGYDEAFTKETEACGFLPVPAPWVKEETS